MFSGVFTNGSSALNRGRSPHPRPRPSRGGEKEDLWGLCGLLCRINPKPLVFSPFPPGRGLGGWAKSGNHGLLWCYLTNSAEN